MVMAVCGMCRMKLATNQRSLMIAPHCSDFDFLVLMIAFVYDVLSTTRKCRFSNMGDYKISKVGRRFRTNQNSPHFLLSKLFC